MNSSNEFVLRDENNSQPDNREFEQTAPNSFPNGFEQELVRLLMKEYTKPPRIAIFGLTGVGKSSTINALFKPGLPVGHVRGTTKTVDEILISLDERRGDLVIIDTPGLGESISQDKFYLQIHQQLLNPPCDVVLWILDGAQRSLAADQKYMLNLLTPDLVQKLVIGVNKIDLIYPSSWIDEFNVPSHEQEQNIALRIQDIREKLAAIGFNPQYVVPYSALRFYGLSHLFRAMLEACSVERAWVLSGRREINTTTFLDGSEDNNDTNE